MDLKKEPVPANTREARKSRKRERYEYEKTLPHYNKTKVVELLSGVLDLPKEKIGDVYSALFDLMLELCFTECVFPIPKIGRFVFEPRYLRKNWNPKIKQTMVYQSPKITFKLSHRLRCLLRKQYRRNPNQLAAMAAKNMAVTPEPPKENLETKDSNE